MNRKNINNILRKILPVSSKYVGAPKDATTMGNYTTQHPEDSCIGYLETYTFEDTLNKLPDFFRVKTFQLSHTNYLAHLKHARVWGRNGAVISEDDYFITDVSREFNDGSYSAHSVYYTLKQKQYSNLPGLIAVVGSAGADIYFHWMIDILPRFALIAKGYSLESIDYFVTEFAGLPFQKETIEKLEIPDSKIIASNINRKFHIKAGTLLVPSLAGPLDQPMPFQVNFLRSLYMDCLSSEIPFRNIYISRGKTGRRKIVNEEVIISCLSDLGFERIYCEELKVSEQAKIFSEAAIIIGSHGSAFTNLIFCQPGSIVLDIFNSSHINPCFWFISRILNLDYHYLSGIPVSVDGNPKNDNTLVDIHQFKKVINNFVTQKPDLLE